MFKVRQHWAKHHIRGDITYKTTGTYVFDDNECNSAWLAFLITYYVDLDCSVMSNGLRWWWKNQRARTWWSTMHVDDGQPRSSGHNANTSRSVRRRVMELSCEFNVIGHIDSPRNPNTSHNVCLWSVIKLFDEYITWILGNAENMSDRHNTIFSNEYIYKLATLVHHSLHNAVPQCMSSSLHPYTLSRQLRSASLNLHSQPCINITLASRGFRFPLEFPPSSSQIYRDSHTVFKSHLNTHLFSGASISGP